MEAYIETSDGEKVIQTVNKIYSQRISFVNAMSALCKATDANVNQVSHAVGTDSRIRQNFFNASVMVFQK